MKLAEIFTDNMVLQRNKPVAVFGEGKGGGYIEFCGKTTVFTNKDDSKFCIYLPSQEAGGPYEMTVCIDDKKTLLKMYLSVMFLWRRDNPIWNLPLLKLLILTSSKMKMFVYSPNRIFRTMRR